MIVRETTEKDLPTVSELWRQMVLESKHDWRPDVDRWQTMVFNFMRAGDLYCCLVAEEKGVIVGFVDGMFFVEPSTGKLHATGQHFFVLPEHRKGTAAGRLYKAALMKAMSKKAEVLELFCFPEQMRFWQKRYFKPTRVLMRLEVNV